MQLVVFIDATRLYIFVERRSAFVEGLRGSTRTTSVTRSCTIPIMHVPSWNSVGDLYAFAAYCYEFFLWVLKRIILPVSLESYWANVCCRTSALFNLDTRVYSNATKNMFKIEYVCVCVYALVSSRSLCLLRACFCVSAWVWLFFGHVLQCVLLTEVVIITLLFITNLMIDIVSWSNIFK